MMFGQDWWSKVPMKLLKIAWLGIETEPKLIFIKKHIINSTINATNDMVYVFGFSNYSKGLKK